MDCEDIGPAMTQAGNQSEIDQLKTRVAQLEVKLAEAVVIIAKMARLVLVDQP